MIDQTMEFSVANFRGRKITRDADFSVEDTLTVEESLKITINGAPFTVTMRTPGREDQLVRGLLFTEDIYKDLETNPVLKIRDKSPAGYITWIDVKIPAEKVGAGIANNRSIMSVSSCGICGKTELEKVGEGKTGLEEMDILDPNAVAEMFAKMNAEQEVFRKSGGSHASAAFSMDGILLAMEEDIGRHNAVDKVIGSLILNKKLKEAKCLLVSGRISYEIVSKSFVAGIPFLASVSAPSSMAVEMSDKFGITLMAFCREDKLTAYSHTDRLKKSEEKLHHQ